MRDYTVYSQEAVCVYVAKYWCGWKWLPFRMVGVAHGTRGLLELVSKERRGIEFVNSFLYDTSMFVREDDIYNVFVYNTPPIRYIVVDDKGNIRDYRSLISRYDERSKTRHTYNTRESMVRNTQEYRKCITGDDIREVKSGYGITLNPIRPKRKSIKCNGYSSSRFQRSWKSQRKSRRQNKMIHM